MQLPALRRASGCPPALPARLRADRRLQPAQYGPQVGLQARAADPRLLDVVPSSAAAATAAAAPPTGAHTSA